MVVGSVVVRGVFIFLWFEDLEFRCSSNYGVEGREFFVGEMEGV